LGSVAPPLVALAVRDVGKVYRRYASPGARVVEALTRRSRHREFHALSGVTLEVGSGTGFGVIGENGAGKSTLLKILAGVTAPTTGSVEVRGSVASILELGAGFHPDFSGRQNIRLNAALFGISEAELERRSPAIAAFSELGDFIDQPVKTYSSGMAMRLAFSIAAELDPLILIVDEALSVGDGYFQKKCMDRLQRYRKNGGTLLLCSHALYYVAAYCENSVWLRDGRVAALGPTEEVIRDYERHLAARSTLGTPTEQPAESPAETAGPARLTHVGIVGPVELKLGDPMEIAIAWESDDPSRKFHLGVGINRSDEVEVASISSEADGHPPFEGRTRYDARLRLPRLPLVKGEFSLYIFLLDEQGLHVYDRRILPAVFSIKPDRYRFGLIAVEHEWRAESEPGLEGG
jgi:lipopolysaccharide transport system ATP-binding protein